MKKDFSFHDGWDLSRPVSHFVVPIDTIFSEQWTIGEVVEKLRDSHISHHVQYFYTKDHHGALSGVISARSLVLNDKDKKISEIADRNIIKINHDSSLEEALHLLLGKELLALPVVDQQGKPLGLFQIPLSEISHISSKIKATKPSKEVFQIIGLHMEESQKARGVWEFVRRMPWLFCNLFAGLVCALIASFFNELLANFVVISLFIPLVLTLGESVAVQSVALTFQLLFDHGSFWKKVKNRFITEVQTATLIGFCCAFVVAALYLPFFGRLEPIYAITATIFVTMIIVSLFGLFIPIILHVFKLDPKVASGPIVLMLTDVTITAVYLLFARFFLQNIS